MRMLCNNKRLLVLTAVSSFLKCSLNFMSVMCRQQLQDESSSENCAADNADYP